MSDHIEPTWTLLLGEVGEGGELMIPAAESIQADGIELPVVLWRMTPWVMDGLLHALAALDQVGEIMHDHSGEGPSGNGYIVQGLESALEHLVGEGRLLRLPDDGVVWHDVPREVSTVQP